jgi:glycosyltransferase involved in cell wall biosynthesis
MENYPLISIVVRTYFRADTLLRTLESIAALYYPPDKLEVIVVNDEKDTASEQTVDSFKQRNVVIEVKVISSPNSASHAWNLGIVSSRGKIVCVSPDDVIFNPLTLKRALELLYSNSKVAAVTFTCIFENSSLQSEIHQMRYIGNSTNNVSTVFLLTFYKKDVLAIVGCYREDLGPPMTIHEDWELGSRIRKQGYSLILDGKMVQTHLERQPKSPSEVTAQATISGRVKIKKFLGSFSSYKNSYINRNYRTFFEVMKSSSLSQKMEYVFYFLMPLAALGLLFFNYFGLIFYLILIISTVDVWSLSKGYYRVFPLKKQLSYPIVLIAARVIRTYLAVLGLIDQQITSHNKPENSREKQNTIKSVDRLSA